LHVRSKERCVLGNFKHNKHRKYVMMLISHLTELCMTYTTEGFHQIGPNVTAQYQSTWCLQTSAAAEGCTNVKYATNYQSTNFRALMPEKECTDIPKKTCTNMKYVREMTDNAASILKRDWLEQTCTNVQRVYLSAFDDHTRRSETYFTNC